MSFTAKDVAELREITGAGMMDCKKALVHTDGDREKAIEYLREIGVSIAAKKASRIASEGLIGGYTCLLYTSDGRHDAYRSYKQRNVQVRRKDHRPPFREILAFRQRRRRDISS